MMTKFNIDKWERFEMIDIVKALSNVQGGAWDAHVAAPRRSVVRNEIKVRAQDMRLENNGVSV